MECHPNRNKASIRSVSMNTIEKFVVWPLLLLSFAISCGGRSSNPHHQSTEDAVEDGGSGGDVGDVGAADTARPDGGDEDATSDSGGEAAVTTLDDGSYVCRPAGSGPFPAVLYNHGGLAMAVGGDLLGTCTALAEAGYLAWSEQRPLSDSPTIAGHLDEVLEALSAVQNHVDADPSRIGLIGYSRGGLLALHTAIERPSDVQAVILMAPAPGGGPTNLDDALERIESITAPVRLLVAENDGPPAQREDHVEICRSIEAALESAGKGVELTIYPPFGDDGHELFFEVREPYWSDVLSFLETHL